MQPYVAYVRISKEEKNREDKGMNRLGIQSQLSDIKRVFGGEPIQIFYDKESRTKESRSNLNKAISFCKEHKIGLRIAFVDRLGVGSHVMNLIEKSGVDIKFAENPNAGILELGIKAIISKAEIDKTSLRQKKAAEEKRRRGQSLGMPQNLTDKSRIISADVRRDKMLNEHLFTYAVINLCDKLGYSLAKTADYLNEYGFTTTNGMLFKPVQVYRIKKAFKEESKRASHSDLQQQFGSDKHPVDYLQTI